MYVILAQGVHKQNYFVIMRLADGGASPGAAGEMTNVSQAFQPSGLFCAANSP
jgi:hypothetical protein